MKKWFLLCVTAALLAACGNDAPAEGDTLEVDPAKRSDMLLEIEDLNQQAFEEEVRMDRAVGHDLMKKYIAFANAFPKDSLTPQFLYDAAMVGRELGRHRQAINLLENVHDGFADYSHRGEAAFLIGWIYQNDLNDRIRAEEYYKKTIELHPGTSWAKSASDALGILNMTEEDLLKFLDEKNPTPAEQ